MKNKFLFICAATLFCACNNQSKNNTEITDSTSQQMDTLSSNKMDTSGSLMNSNPTMTADPKTTSFLKDAADGGMAEVQIAQMAQDKASNQRVKDFAGMMVRDHSAANDQIKQLASQRSVMLPDSISAQHKKAKDDLEKKEGKAFDKAYIDAMVKGHQQVIDMFEKASKNVPDASVKSFIDNTLPTLKVHLDSAKAIQKSIR